MLLPRAMTSTDPQPGYRSREVTNFSPTHWSVVLAAAGRADSTHARDALEKLCRNYWLPIYVFVRRQGHSPHDAQDLTQEFFARLLEKNYLAGVQREKGRFRSFLLASVKHFLANEWDKANAQKRGGGQVPISIDAGWPKARFAWSRRTLSPRKKFTNAAGRWRCSNRSCAVCARNTRATARKSNSSN